MAEDKDKSGKERIIKEQEKRPGNYQSDAFPEPFENEGGEYITVNQNKKEDLNHTEEDVDFDKMKGNKK